MSTCCICKSSVDDKGKNKAKKLNGRAFVVERAILSKSVEERCGVNIDNVGLKDFRCIVCYNCTRTLGKIRKYQEEIEKMTDEVVENFKVGENTLTVEEENNGQCEGASISGKAPKRRKIYVSVLQRSTRAFSFV